MYTYSLSDENHYLTRYGIYQSKDEIGRQGTLSVDARTNGLTLNFMYELSNADRGTIAVNITTIEQLTNFLYDVGEGLYISKHENLEHTYLLASNRFTNPLGLGSMYSNVDTSKEHELYMKHVRDFVMGIPIRNILHNEGWMHFLK